MGRGASDNAEVILYGRARNHTDHEQEPDPKEGLLESYQPEEASFSASCPARKGDYEYVYSVTCQVTGSGYREDETEYTAELFTSEADAQAYIRDRESIPGGGVISDDYDEKITARVTRKSLLAKSEPPKVTVYHYRKTETYGIENFQRVQREDRIPDQVLTGFELSSEPAKGYVEARSYDPKLAEKAFLAEHERLLEQESSDG